MSRRAIKKQKLSVEKLLKTVIKKMEDFETAVEDLKLFKEEVIELNDVVISKEAENTAILKQLQIKLKENKLKILNEEASIAGKVIISREQLDELKQELAKAKGSRVEMRNAVDDTVEEKVEELLRHKLKIQEVEHKASVSTLNASLENRDREIEMLKESFARMGDELSSQKKLTAQVAGLGRKQEHKSQEQ